MAGNTESRVLLIGLDCAEPSLVFERWAEELPNLTGLAEKGKYGRLQSTIPPITCPAWMSMMTGKSPGRLGVYGFRNRGDYSYTNLQIANSTWIKDEKVWDILSRVGKKSVVIGVPETYPPKPFDGCLITSFLTPSTQSQYTHPPELKAEVEEVADGYIIDCENFRTDNKDELLAQIYEMTEKRFRVARHLLEAKEWSFFMMVEMGPDRIHHGFWKYFDQDHIKYEPGSKYEEAVKEYYKYVDREVGDLIALAPEGTNVIVASDHGAKKMDGGICLNEWLIQEGYLKLKSQPSEVARLESMEIDWSQTRAWGSGGYYGRLFINVEGREPNGTVKKEDYDSFRDELIAKLEALPDHQGNPIGTRAIRPEEAYTECKNIPPDLIVYFGDLDWRAVGSVGLNTIYTFENDTGPDDANHAEYGLIIMSGPGIPDPGEVEGMSVMDVAPTVLTLLGVEVPEDMQGKSSGSAAEQDTYSEEEEEEVMSRLEALGYL